MAEAYLTNKNLMSEIHRSKVTYCSFTDERYADYDAIVDGVEDVTLELIAATKVARVKRDAAQARADARAQGLRRNQIKVVEADPETIQTEDLVWRVMTYDHIPEEEGRVRNPKREADDYARLNFNPFKHFIIKDGEFVEVGRSHWQGSVDNGCFSVDHGEMTRKLAKMFLKLVERYGQRYNWRGYTYNEEMQGQALVQLCEGGLKFDESKGSNPFAYYTTICANAFTRVLNSEKRKQNLRDDILEMHGKAASTNRQVDNEGW